MVVRPNAKAAKTLTPQCDLSPIWNLCPRDSLAIFVQRVRRVRVDCDYSYSTIRVSLVLSSADTKNPNRENIQRHQRSLPTPPVQLASPTCEAHPTGGSWKLIWGQFTIELPPVICYTGAC